MPSPGDLPDPGIEPRSPALQADSLLSKPPGKPHVNQSDSQHPTVVPRLCPIRTPPPITSLDLLLMTLPLDCSTSSKTSLLVFAYRFQACFNLRALALAVLCLGYSFSGINRPHPPTSFRSLLTCHFVSEGPLTFLSQVEETPTRSHPQFLHQNWLVEGKRGLAVGWPQVIAVEV